MGLWPIPIFSIQLDQAREKIGNNTIMFIAWFEIAIRYFIELIYE